MRFNNIQGFDNKNIRIFVRLEIQGSASQVHKNLILLSVLKSIMIALSRNYFLSLFLVEIFDGKFGTYLLHRTCGTSLSVSNLNMIVSYSYC